MEPVTAKFEQTYRKADIPKIKSGDSVRVQQKVREAGKERVQMFEGTVIRTRRLSSLTATLTVRRLASGVGVEKTYLLHSPNLVKVEVVKRSRVRRNYLTYLRERQGKATRLQEVGFDKDAVNVKDEPKPIAKDKEEVKPEAEVQTKAETKTTAPTEAAAKVEGDAKESIKDDKVAAKKAKAEAFRKAQEAKQK